MSRSRINILIAVHLEPKTRYQSLSLVATEVSTASFTSLLIIHSINLLLSVPAFKINNCSTVKSSDHELSLTNHFIKLEITLPSTGSR
jgi:hypothetical protein